MKPKCFGEYPIKYPHAQAENCCNDCPWNHSCFEYTPILEQKILDLDGT